MDLRRNAVPFRAKHRAILQRERKRRLVFNQRERKRRLVFNLLMADVNVCKNLTKLKAGKTLSAKAQHVSPFMAVICT